jgi:hypothetical protein
MQQSSDLSREEVEIVRGCLQAYIASPSLIYIEIVLSAETS